MNRQPEIAAEEAGRAVAGQPAGSGELMLFTTKTCPNCKLAKSMLDQAGIGYKLVDAEDNAYMSMKYGIMSAPALVVLKGEESENIINLSNIKKFAESVIG
jgi:ribonucleoside-triphosphate reductase